MSQSDEETLNRSDGISKLPSHILVSILSFLPMKEAARTSILSTRWRSLWTFFSGTLDFDASLSLEEIRFPLGSEVKSLRDERKRFISWVNHVLGLHQAPTLNGFRIVFDVGCESGVDDWIKFAVEKKVKKLELDFTDLRTTSLSRRYVFPPHFFNTLSLSSLTALHLKCVDVSGDTLEYLLAHSPFLEALSVKNSTSLISFNISGPTLNLKNLELWCCRNFENLEISAANLVSFMYSGPEVVHFRNVPKLVEVRVVASFFKFIVNNVLENSGFLSQLETLSLNFPGPINLIITAQQQVPKLTNLKNLELKVSTLDSGDLSILALLMRACSSLQKLMITVCHGEKSSKDAKIEIEEHLYPCLKIVKLVGFVGSATEVELFMHLHRNAVALEKITIDPSPPYLLNELFKSRAQLLQSKYKETKEYQSARECAFELRKKLLSQLEFLVL